MNFFKKLFSKKEPEFNPDNSRLLRLLTNYNTSNTQADYKLVLEELYGNQAFLIVPTPKSEDDIPSDEWKTLEKGMTVDFNSVYNIDGLLVFGVFTSEQNLSKWTKVVTSFIAMPSKNVLELAEQNNFGRIVIDSDQDTMFVLERNTSNHNKTVIKEDTKVLLWTPESPIDGGHKKQLLTAFAKVSSIEVVYHFGMTRNDEPIYILAFLLNTDSEEAKLAVMSGINDGMNGYSLDFPLEIIYFKEHDHWFETCQKFDEFYRRC